VDIGAGVPNKCDDGRLAKRMPVTGFFCGAWEPMDEGVFYRNPDKTPDFMVNFIKSYVLQTISNRNVFILLRGDDYMSPQEVASMRRRTPNDPIAVPDHPGPAHSIQDEPLNTDHRFPQKRKARAGGSAPGGLRFPCCGLTLACSVYRTVDQLGK
jgi:hypothetical protein